MLVKAPEATRNLTDRLPTLRRALLMHAIIEANTTVDADVAATVINRLPLTH